MIGLSLSFCIKDMANGVVSPDEVEKIICGTIARPGEELDEVISMYRSTYWKGNPDIAEQLVRKLLAEGKIEQPRLTTGQLPKINNGHWVESEDQIEWIRKPESD